METEPLSQKAHTRVPNLIYDIVLWLVEAAERDCLLYIVRRTYGFADPAGGRKARDTISLEQFEHGITSGSYLLDLGTQRSRNTIRRALDGLEAKGLVEPRYSCTNCYWEEGPERQAPPPSEQGRAISCPRCRSSLSRSWALAELTPRKLLELLNKHDKQGREWSWDAEAERFRFKSPESVRETRSRADLEEEAKRLRGLLWYPEMVDALVDEAAKVLTSGRKVSLQRRINGFYKPVYELQEEFSNPPLLKYALTETAKAKILSKPRNRNWHRYLRAVVENNQSRFRPDATPAKVPAETDEEVMRERELAARQLLAQAAKLNGAGQLAEARALLSDILAQVEDLTPLFEGDRALCERSLREAFKQGSSDFVSIRPKPHGLDFYPEWNWDSEPAAA